MRTGNGVVFAVAGAKGGVGKTTTSINLSAVLAELGHDVVLVELDLAMANIGDFLDLDVRLEHGRDATLHEVLADTASVADATYEAPGGFDVVPSGVTLQGFANADIDAVADVVQEARSVYDVVVLDTGAGVGTMTVLPLSLADETILVSSPRVASIRDTKKTEHIVQHVDGTVAGVVFVKSGTGRSPGVSRIADHLSVDLLGHVPEDDDVASAQDIGRPVVLARPESDAAKAYRSLGSVVDDRLDAFEPAQTRDDESDAPLTTEDADVDEFDYVGGIVDDAVDDEDDFDAVDDIDDAADDEEHERESTVSATTETETTDRDDTDESDGDEVETDDVDTDESDEDEVETVAGATDDEIAARLELLESADAGRTTRSSESDGRDVSDHPPHPQTPQHPVEDASSAGTESSASPDGGAGTDDLADENRSAARRLIDRAFGLVGRPRT